MDDGHAGPQARQELGPPRAARSLPMERPAVYLFPCRIQQGWGDVQEMAAAAWALHRAGFPLLSLPPRPEAGRRPDPRASPVEPPRAGPARFPPVRRVARPQGTGRAMVLATWWGVTARTHDADGGPLPGPLESAVGSIVDAHGEGNVLHVSLEEFASDQTSYEALDEGLRQAGWPGPRRRAALKSASGREQCATYHRAFVLARAGERKDVLHLTGSLAPHLPALREFPFLLPVGPFGMARRSTRARPPAPPSTRRAPVILWYATRDGAADFARSLLSSLDALDRPVRLEVRAEASVVEALPGRSPGGRVAVRPLGVLEGTAWKARWRRADLRIASGSQTLVESVRLGLPFLYFNGALAGPHGSSRAFRREKFVSWLRAMQESGSSSLLRKDLSSFADGKGLDSVLRHSLLSARWRREFVRDLRRCRSGLVSSRADGDTFLVEIACRFAESSGPASDLVERLRLEHPRRLQRTPSRAAAA